MTLTAENKIELKDLLNDNVLPFSRYTITDRAIPAVEDGLKAIHRRILWSMFTDGLNWDKKRTKSLKASGAVLRYSPHGSPYDAMVRLANDSVNIQLIDGKGAFSSITTTEQAGAERYTNVRLSKYSSELLKHIKKDAVEMVKNYDDSLFEPYRLPAPLPNILVNANKGIANGIATNIPSFNFNDVIDNTINIIEGKETFVMYPDFRTGGIVQEDYAVADNVRKNGRGSFKLRAKYYVEGNTIYVTEIPYSTKIENIIQKIIDDEKAGLLKEVTDVNNNSGVQGLEIAIDFKRGTDPDKLIAKLFKLTPLESTFGCNFNVLVNNKPIVIGTEDIMKEWLKTRIETLKRITKFELGKKAKDAYQLEGLQKVLLDVDRAIEIIKNSETDELIVSELSKEFEIDKAQAENIANMKLRNINKKFILNKTKQLEQLKKSISQLEGILSSETKVKNIIKKELLALKEEYGFERITEIENFESIEYSELDSHEEYATTVFLTADGYIKKLPHSSQRGNYINKIKDGDVILEELETNNDGELLVFTNKYNVHKIRISDIPDHKPSQFGTYIESEIELDKDEKVLYTLITKDFSEHLIIGFSDGKVARISLSAYETKQNRKKLQNAFANKMVILFKKITNDIDILAVSDIKKGTLFNTSMINVKNSKTSQGSQVQKSKDDSKTVAYHIIDDEKYEYYRVKSAGVGKYLRKEDDI